MARTKKAESNNNTVIISELPTINPTSFNIDSLTNAKLIEKVNLIQGEMLRATQNVSKSGLKVAMWYHDIVNGELFADDFTSKDAFAKFMGISPSNLSNMVNAAKFVKTYGKNYKANQLSVEKARLLMNAEKKGFRNEFEKWMKENGIPDLEFLSDSAMKAAWSDFKDTHPGLIPAPKKKEKDNGTDSEPVTATDNTLEGGEKVVTIQYGNKVFSVPAKVWKAFLKENAKA